ncbi:cryptochrome/photolyase family protein [Microscilla marina]|uniref:Deoxyribodipyrimidine photo-lyase n=1 Tax=Microscilla marina ATCC 23134 TaxID=313606 RepID=A1ZTE8_MICM2|nr:deoxyribodipyrimidine photo-lyase [Microscilla marina]EAY26370.1 deoxyribodipyrimidine photo-lyase [Microscilla marina ATCC 23134]
MNSITVFWFRRDLRLHDNTGLYEALKNEQNVLPIFIFDRHILDDLEDKKDLRVAYIYAALQQIQQSLADDLQSSLKVYYDYPEQVFEQLTQAGITLNGETYQVKSVYTNHDYEPYARQRDEKVQQILSNSGVAWHSFKDQVIFEKQEVLTNADKPYTVFTPYSKKWKHHLTDAHLQERLVASHAQNLLKLSPQLPLMPLEKTGFVDINKSFSSKTIKKQLVIDYQQNRDFPAVQGTSRLSVHLRFGTVSIRKIVKAAQKYSDTWLNELIWREFYMMILYSFPHVVDKSFKPAYDCIQWRNNPDEFKRWCEGTTGYPIVDAGMRELNTTGFMHNRVRMITASFLTKHLLIDWRWGEAYFAKKLLDYDLSANNGGWQWAAGSGCDAAPYFRVFNPYAQTEKFDKQRQYIRQWVPEFELSRYPAPIVEHKFARQRALDTYKAGLSKEATV